MTMSEGEKKWEARIDAALGVAASAILMVLMLVTFADVVSRYLLNWPLRGAFEVTELMLLVLIFAGLPLVSHADEHVTMDFIDRILPAAATRGLIRLVHGLCAAVMFFVAWQVWLKAGKIAGYGDTTDVLRVPVGPFVYFMAAAVALTGLVHVLRVFVPGTRRGAGTTAQATT
jgi:TRAP-type C4-dicarboxylate transport system permease small subunit